MKIAKTKKISKIMGRLLFNDALVVNQTNDMVVYVVWTTRPARLMEDVLWHFRDDAVNIDYDNINNQLTIIFS